MAIKIKSASGKGITGGVAGLPPTMQEVDIGVDTEAEILAFPAFGEPITDKYGVSAIPAELSIAHTPRVQGSLRIESQRRVDENVRGPAYESFYGQADWADQEHWRR